MYKESSDDEGKCVDREVRKHVLPAPYVDNDRQKDDRNFHHSQVFHLDSLQSYFTASQSAGTVAAGSLRWVFEKLVLVQGRVYLELDTHLADFRGGL